MFLLYRNIVLFVLLFGIGTLSHSCRQSDSREVSDKDQADPLPPAVNFDLDKIRERGYIIAIMDNSSTGLFIYKGQTMGYEYELLQLFAQSLGLKLQINVTASLEAGFKKLNLGEGDILAYNLTVTKSRKKRIAFSHYLHLERQVLVQRKPEGWRKMKLHEIEGKLIRNPIDLIGKEVHVRHHSSYLSRLQNLSDEIGGDIIIIQADPEAETETLIKNVAEGEISYTVAEEDIAKVNATYYPNLDVETAVSFPTQIAWGVRNNAGSLLDTLNDWLLQMRKKTAYYVIYDKYFKSSKSSLRRTKSDYFSLSGGMLSPYDDLIREAAEKLGWDWRLLAAQIYRESKFDPEAKSWTGAIGLMQLLPVTGQDYGVDDLMDPTENIKAGTSHLLWLSDYFGPLVDNPQERLKFILAAYNVGHGHVVDAMRLTEKYNGDPQKWEGNVREYLLKKSKEKYFNDPVVKYGYCRGAEPVSYVSAILSIYKNYQELYPIEEEDSLINENI